MIKNYYKLLVILLVSSLLTGCWDYEDVNRRSIRLSVGVDKVNDKIEFSGENANLLRVSEIGGSKTQIPTTNYYIASGNDLEEVKEKINQSSPLEDFSGAMRVVVFGKNYAEAGIEPYINRINHLTYLRKSLLIVISRETPKELFQKQVTNDIAIGYAIEDTIRQLSKNGQCLYISAQEVQANIQNKEIGYILPYVGMEGNTVKHLGCAIMKDNKMVRIISIEESRGVLYLLLKKAVATQTISEVSNRDNLYSISSTLKRRKIKTNYADKKINIDIDIKLDLQLQYQYKTDLLNEHIIKELESEVAKKVEKEILHVINLSQKEFKLDVFKFAKYFKAQNPKEYKELTWKEEYPNASINVNVEAKMKNINLMNYNKKKILRFAYEK